MPSVLTWKSTQHSKNRHVKNCQEPIFKNNHKGVIDCSMPFYLTTFSTLIKLYGRHLTISFVNKEINSNGTVVNKT